MPALIGVFLSLTAFVIGQRCQRKFGLEAAFLIAFIPTSVRFLGPSFYVASTLGLLLLLFIIWLGQLKKIQSILLIPVFIFYLLYRPSNHRSSSHRHHPCLRSLLSHRKRIPHRPPHRTALCPPYGHCRSVHQPMELHHRVFHHLRHWNSIPHVL